MACLTAAPGCENGKEREIIFCESFDEADIPLGEDSIFTRGSVSMLVQLNEAAASETISISVYSMENGDRVPYGRQARIEIDPGYHNIRLDDAVSFADTGRFVVTVSMTEPVLFAEKILRIVPSAEPLL